MKLINRFTLVLGIWFLIIGSIVYTFSLNNAMYGIGGISSAAIFLGSTLIGFSFQVEGKQ